MKFFEYEKSYIEMPENKITLEVLVKRISNSPKKKGVCATVIITAIKNIGLVYRPNIDCVEIDVPELNIIERLLGVTVEQKIDRYIDKLERKIRKRINKGKTLEEYIWRQIEERRKQFLAS